MLYLCYSRSLRVRITHAIRFEIAIELEKGKTKTCSLIFKLHNGQEYSTTREIVVLLSARLNFFQHAKLGTLDERLGSVNAGWENHSTHKPSVIGRKFKSRSGVSTSHGVRQEARCLHEFESCARKDGSNGWGCFYIRIPNTGRPTQSELKQEWLCMVADLIHMHNVV